MNMTLTELDFIGVTVEGQPNTAALQASIRAQMWTVITFERTGDATVDPFRTANGFFDQGRATTFANAFRSTCGQYCVLLYQGTALQQVIAGDPSLLELWRARTGMAAPTALPSELNDITVEAVSGDPSAITNGGAYVDQSADTDPDASNNPTS